MTPLDALITGALARLRSEGMPFVVSLLRHDPQAARAAAALERARARADRRACAFDGSAAFDLDFDLVPGTFERRGRRLRFTLRRARPARTLTFVGDDGWGRVALGSWDPHKAPSVPVVGLAGDVDELLRSLRYRVTWDEVQVEPTLSLATFVGLGGAEPEEHQVRLALVERMERAAVVQVCDPPPDLSIEVELASAYSDSLTLRRVAGQEPGRFLRRLRARRAEHR